MSRVGRVATTLWKGLPSGVGKQVTAAYFKANAFYKLGRHGCHSCQSLVKHQEANMRVRVLPALSDNYMYLIIDETTREAAVVDPVAPETVFEAVKSEGVNLTKVLTTHHHWDHAGGNKKMVEVMPKLAIYGGDDRIDALTHKLVGGEDLNIGRLKVKCLFTPCHTTGHICYFVTEESGKEPAVFTGDTLFLGGCGRFFEGTAEQMNEALNQVLANLPDHTKVYCGHEYAIQNLTFGHHVEPDNPAISQKLAQVKRLRASNPPQPSVPSTIGEEKHINPFMRVDKPNVMAFCGGANAVDTMRRIRSIKDTFKPK